MRKFLFTKSISFLPGTVAPSPAGTPPRWKTTARNLLVILLVFLFSVICNLKSIYAIDCEGDPPKDDVNKIQEYQKACEEKIGSLQNQQKSLQSTIKLLDSQIRLTLAQISSTNAQIVQLQKDITTLSNVIEGLNQELDTLTSVFVARVRQNYRQRHSDRSLNFLTNLNLSTLQSQIKYLSMAQKRDQIIMHELEKSRLDYDQQKTTKEEKQAEVAALKLNLEKQQKTLLSQQAAKKQLLAETQNSEARYQALLEKAVAELRAIESIIAGKGSEVEVGDISKNQKVATIISGASACSTGTHLHFEVVKDKSHQSPAGYLKNISVVWSNQPDNPFSFTGSWDWPLHEPIRITQGYGHTAYSSRYAGDQHTGLDMVAENREVVSVKDGKLFRGSIPCGGGTLKYVHVKHKDEALDTYYLHVNYF